MSVLIVSILVVALLVSGLVSVSLSVPLQAPVAILLGLAAILASGLVWKDRSVNALSSERVGTGKPWGLLLVVSILYFIGRAWLSPVFDLGVEDLMLIFPASILYLLAGHMMAGRTTVIIRQSLAWVVILLLLLHFGACAFQLRGGEGYSLSRYFTSAMRASSSSVTGMYGYRGSFANFAVVSGLLCLNLGGWGRVNLSLRGILICLGAIAIGLVLWSRSRSAALSLVPALTVMGSLWWVSLSGQSAGVRRKGRTIILILGLLGSLGGLLGVTWVFKERNTTGIVSVVDSGARPQFWSMAGEQWADYPFFGAGGRSYSYESFRYWSPSLSTAQPNPEFVHNEYLQLLADYGILGLVLVLSLLVVHLLMGFKHVGHLSRCVRKNGLGRGANAMALAITGMSGIAAMAVHVIFDFRTHLLPNLLLLVCCAVWVLPIRSMGGDSGQQVTDDRLNKVRKSRLGGACTSLFIFMLGLGAVGLGGQQLWAGWPLLDNRIAKEGGVWHPEKVNRKVWIPTLETSLKRMPHWRRSQRLGTLYRLEAGASTGDERNRYLKKAKTAYKVSLDRHPYNPIPKINLAAIYADAGEYKKADAMYASASGRAAARERWFRVYALWATLHRNWAVALWRQGDEKREVEFHFLRARELYKVSSHKTGFVYWRNKWAIEYTILLISYARYLDSLGEYEKADALFVEASRQIHAYNNQPVTKLNLYRAWHYYDMGMHQWKERKPKKAYTTMKWGKNTLLHYPGAKTGKVDQEWKDLMHKIQEVMDFLEKTGESE